MDGAAIHLADHVKRRLYLRLRVCKILFCDYANCKFANMEMLHEVLFSLIKRHGNGKIKISVTCSKIHWTREDREVPFMVTKGNSILQFKVCLIQSGACSDKAK